MTKPNKDDKGLNKKGLKNILTFSENLMSMKEGSIFCFNLGKKRFTIVRIK